MRPRQLALQAADPIPDGLGCRQAACRLLGKRQAACRLLILLLGCANCRTGSLAAGIASSGTACANLGRSSATERAPLFLSVSISQLHLVLASLQCWLVHSSSSCVAALLLGGPVRQPASRPSANRWAACNRHTLGMSAVAAAHSRRKCAEVDQWY